MDNQRKIKELEERVEQLENLVNEIIEWSQNVTVASQVKTDNEVNDSVSDDLFQVISFDVKKKPTEKFNSGGFLAQEYAWKLKVKNLCSNKISLFGEVVFQDCDGFDLDSSSMNTIELASGATSSETGIARIMDQGKAADVAEVSCRFNVY